MAGADRSASPDLSAQLRDGAWRFDFFAALRLLECARPDAPRVGKAARAREAPLRLGQEPQLTFAAASLASFAPAAAAGAPDRLSVLLLGLFGSGGPLPLHLTAHALDRRRQSGDDAFIDFCDLLQDRLIALFYRAWADARPQIQHDRPEQDRFRLYVGALAGFGLPALRDADALPDRFKLHHAGLIGCQSGHAERVQMLVQDLLGVPAVLEELVGGWLDIPERLRSRLGGAGAQLGVDAVVGIASYQRQHRCRLKLGPLDLPTYQALLPGGARLERLTALMRMLVGDAIEWDLGLALQPREVPPLRLDGSARLGWTSWLPAWLRYRMADDLVLTPQRASA